MAWYDEAFFYHIYPLGLCGAPKTNSYGEEEHRLRELWPWVEHLEQLGVTGLYIGPLSRQQWGPEGLCPALP